MKWLVTLWIVISATPGLASPDVGAYRDIKGVRVYKDHENKSLWYLSPPPPQLTVNEDGSPDYGFNLYRYLGRRGTGDSGRFWVRGVLTLGVNRERDSKTTSQVREQLKKDGIPHPVLRSMPVTGTEVRLLFADQDQTWKYGTRWKGQLLVLALDQYMSQILWDAVEAEHIIISLVVEERFKGVRKAENEWQGAETALPWTLPIELDMATHPERFRRTELGGQMVRGYTGLDVFCFDFLEGLAPNLYAKIVEVAIPTEGLDLVERMTFKADSDYRQRIEFKLSKDIDQPYRVRITRILKDGRSDAGPWTNKVGESLLDITAYREPEDSSGAEDEMNLPAE